MPQPAARARYRLGCHSSFITFGSAPRSMRVQPSRRRCEMRLIRALLLAVVSALVASGVVYFAFVRPKVRGWGLDPHEAELPLPGDDLITDPSHVETRGITIH